jgi:hypothetical protein
MFSVVVATPKSPVEDGLLVMRDTVARRTTFDFGAVSQALCGSACRRFEFVDWHWYAVGAAEHENLNHNPALVFYPHDRTRPGQISAYHHPLSDLEGNALHRSDLRGTERCLDFADALHVGERELGEAIGRTHQRQKAGRLLDQRAVDGFVGRHRDEEVAWKNTLPPNSRAVSREPYLFLVLWPVSLYLSDAQEVISLLLFPQLNDYCVPPIVLFDCLIDLDLQSPDCPHCPVQFDPLLANASPWRILRKAIGANPAALLATPCCRDDRHAADQPVFPGPIPNDRWFNLPDQQGESFPSLADRPWTRNAGPATATSIQSLAAGLKALCDAQP